MNDSGLPVPTLRAFNELERGRSPNRNLFNYYDVQYYHRIVYTGAAETLEFFGSAASYAEPTTNWPASQGLPPGTAMWLTHFGFEVEIGNSIAGDEVANGILGSDGGLTAADVAEEKRGLLQAGHINGTNGNRTFLRGYGLQSFPAGQGCDGAASIAATGASNLCNNGVPSLHNRFAFDPWVAILPQDPVSVKVNFGAARTLAANVVIKAMMWGKVIRQANR